MVFDGPRSGAETRQIRGVLPETHNFSNNYAILLISVLLVQARFFFEGQYNIPCMMQNILLGTLLSYNFWR